MSEVMSAKPTKINLLNFNRAGLREYFSSIGEKPFRADQMMKWIYQAGVSDFDQMTNLNKALREKLKAQCEVKAPEIAYQQGASDGTIKFALRLEGGQEVETVWIPDADRATLCVSSQVGCAMACSFCATVGSNPFIPAIFLANCVFTFCTAFSVLFVGHDGRFGQFNHGGDMRTAAARPGI